MLASHPDAGTAQPERRGFDVEHYAAEVRPEIAGRALTGRVTIAVRATADAVRMLTFDRGALVIDGAWTGGGSVQVETPDRVVVVHLPSRRPAGVGDDRLSRQSAERLGLRPRAATGVYDLHHPPVDGVGRRARRQGNARPARHIAARSADRRQRCASWPHGFWRRHRRASLAAAPAGVHLHIRLRGGPLSEATTARRATTLRYLGDGVSPAELTRAFADTADMLAFFERRAGVPYPTEAYTQVLVANMQARKRRASRCCRRPTAAVCWATRRRCR